MSTQEFTEAIEVIQDEEGLPQKVVMRRKGTKEDISRVDRGQVLLIIILLREILRELKEINKTISFDKPRR